MPILELPPNPARLRDPDRDQSVAVANAAAGQPVKVRVRGRGEFEEHELIHLLDSIDDELSKSRFRESIYISTIVCLAVAWFVFYGPRVLFHQPDYKDFISAMKEHDKQITYLETPRMPTVAPRPPAHPMPDRKTLQQLQQQPRVTAPAPAQTQQPAQTTAAPQEQAHVTSPPVEKPVLPLPSAPTRPAQPLPDAPGAAIAQNVPSARDNLQSAIRGARGGASGQFEGPSPGSAGPLQAGTQILSDTMDVDFSAYMRRLHNDIQRNWDPLIPEEVQAPLSKKGIVGIRFTILPGGQIGAMTLETRSGDVALDRAAWNAITSEGNFPPLPKEFHGPLLELRCGFFYNTPIEQ